MSNSYFLQIGHDIDGEAAYDYSGSSVSLSSDGSIVAIGAKENDGNGTESGHVRIYQNISGTWTQIGDDIDGEAARDYSGSSVSLSSDGSVVAIGAYGNDGNGSDSGHVRIYQTATIDSAGGAWSYIPDTNFNGTDSFTVTVTDDNGNTQTQEITLTINPTDDPLVISGDLSGSGKDCDGIISGTMIATDLADGLTNHNPYSVTTAALNGTAEITSSGTWNYTPNQAFNGNDSFTVTITDDDGHTLDQVIQISVSPSIVLHSGLSYEETTPSIVGTADAGTIIKLIYNETVVGTSKTDNNGYFSIIPSVNLLEGDNLITITSSDSENNLLSSIEHTLSIEIPDAELNLPTIIGPDDTLVTIYENSRKLFCTCPDAKSWAKKHKCLCKHICFLLFKVFKNTINKETKYLI